MAALAGVSTRQLQRTLRQITGFAPHDLLKVLRLQQSFRHQHLDLFADQSHFTHAFRQAIGCTPGQYRKAFGVRFPQDGDEVHDWSRSSLVIQEHAMQNTNAIGWFDLYVDDTGRATTFYETVFQRRLVPIGDPTGETVMYSSFPSDKGAYGAGGALVRSPHGRPGPGGTMVYFSEDDCAVEAGRVAAAGGQLLRPKFSIGDFGWVDLCADTEGNLFGLSSMRWGLLRRRRNCLKHPRGACAAACHAADSGGGPRLAGCRR